MDAVCTEPPTVALSHDVIPWTGGQEEVKPPWNPGCVWSHKSLISEMRPNHGLRPARTWQGEARERRLCSLRIRGEVAIAPGLGLHVDCRTDADVNSVFLPFTTLTAIKSGIDLSREIQAADVRLASPERPQKFFSSWPASLPSPRNIRPILLCLAEPTATSAYGTAKEPLKHRR